MGVTTAQGGDTERSVGWGDHVIHLSQIFVTLLYQFYLPYSPPLRWFYILFVTLSHTSAPYVYQHVKYVLVSRSESYRKWIQCQSYLPSRSCSISSFSFSSLSSRSCMSNSFCRFSSRLLSFASCILSFASCTLSSCSPSGWFCWYRLIDAVRRRFEAGVLILVNNW
jgi:hypothetical protein